MAELGFKPRHYHSSVQKPGHSVSLFPDWYRVNYHSFSRHANAAHWGCHLHGTPVSQRTQRPRGVQQPAPGHSARKGQRQGPNPKLPSSTLLLVSAPTIFSTTGEDSTQAARTTVQGSEKPEEGRQGWGTAELEPRPPLPGAAGKVGPDTKP